MRGWTGGIALGASLLLAIGLWWASGSPPAPQAPAVAAVGAVPEAPKRAEKRRPKVTVRRTSAPTPEAAPEEEALPELAPIAYKDLPPEDKRFLSRGQPVVGEAINIGCLAPAAARTGRTEPLTVEIEVSTTRDGLHEIEFVDDADADDAAVDCLEDMLWRLPWATLSVDGVVTQSWKLVVDPTVPPVPFDEVVQRAEGVWDATFPPAD